MINEAIELSVDLVSAIAGRCGRFPSKADGGPTWFGIIGDTNAPVEGSDWWKMFEEDRPADWQLFRQPSGLSPEAENLENLPPGYYERLAVNPNADWGAATSSASMAKTPPASAVFRESLQARVPHRGGVWTRAGQTLLVGQDFGR